MDLSYALVDKLHRFSFDDLPSPVVEKTKYLILDTLGVAIAGSTAAGCKEVVDQVVTWGGREESTVWVYGQKVPAFLAAFVNSMMTHARDFDETHDRGLTHSFVSILPTGLAVSEQQANVAGEEFITAVVLGAELLIRLSLSLKPEQAKDRPFSRWHFSAINGFLGSALTAGRLLRLEKPALHNAIGIALSQVAGSRQARADGALTKRMQPAFAAKGGVFAAYLAAKGITGAKNIFEGDFGYYNLYREPSMPYDGEELTHELGQRFEILNISVKPYPCARPTHAAIRPTVDLVRRENIDAKDVEQVKVSVPYKTFEAVGKPFEMRSNPQVDAQFSIPYTVALALERGGVTLADFETGAVRDPAIVGLAKRVEVSVNQEAEGWIPVKVEIRLKDGRTYSAEERALRGDPRNPMTKEEVIKKFRDCARFAAKSMTGEKVEKCIELIDRLEKIKNMRELTRLLA